MRVFLRRRAPTHRLLGALGVALLVAVTPLRAQSNSAALDLLFPIGARSTALGNAFIAERGSEAIWHNPAGMARVAASEFSIDHFSTFAVEGGDAIALVIPVHAVGAFGLSARMFNYGDQSVTDSITKQEIGVESERTIVYGASFATSFSRLDAGISFRYYDLSSPCSGVCGAVVSGSSGTAAFDAGVLYRITRDSAWEAGALLSNVGPALQVHDHPQADGLPTRFTLGLAHRLNLKDIDPNLQGRLSGDLVLRPGNSSPELHLGAEAGYASGETSVFVRGGLIFIQGEDAASSTGPSLGLGLANKRVRVDLARVFESFSTGLGKPPTYLSIRLTL